MTKMKSVVLCAVLVMSGALAGCGGGGDKPVPPPPPPTNPINVAGIWEINEMSLSNGCGVETKSYLLYVDQMGTALTIYDDLGRSYNATLNGRNVVASGPVTYAEDGGMTTITQISIRLPVSERQLEGDSEWQWSDGFSFCSGSTTFSGRKI